MRRKILTHFVKTIPDMFAGWRMADDLGKLSELPNGVIQINLLSGEARHSIVGVMDLYISKEISAWLSRQFEAEGIETGKIQKAHLQVGIDTDKVKTDKKKVVNFNFKMECRIQTDEKEYVAIKEDLHIWHSRL